MADIHCEALTPERLTDYLAFFDGPAFADNPHWSSCYCYFPIHDPKTTDWKTRTAPENRAAASTSVVTGRTHGYLAYAGTDVVGWCNAGPWSQFPMLRDDPEPDVDTLGVIFCFIVAPQARGQGAAAALLEAACRGLRRQGMTVVQAKPVRHAASPAANHLGPLSMYLKAGFEIVRETPQGDVYVRKILS